MTITGIHHSALASASAVLLRFTTAFCAWRAERRDRRALEQLSDEQLKDIGYRRIPSEPPHYQRLGS